MGISTKLSAELVQNWLLGRARIRGNHLTTSGDVHAALHVSESGEEFWEYALANPGQSILDSLAAEIKNHPTRTLIVALDLPDNEQPAGELARQLEEHTGLRAVSVNEKLLVTDMVDQDVEAPLVPEEFEAVVERHEQDWSFLRLVTTDAHPQGAGIDAARGRVADVGDHAVFDQVWTSPDFRRQGLGSLVMRYLTSVAHETYVEEGLLIAGQDGQKLYKHLGWTPLADVVVLGHPDAPQQDTAD